jgi:hypothetical protein
VPRIRADFLRPDRQQTTAPPVDLRFVIQEVLHRYLAKSEYRFNHRTDANVFIGMVATTLWIQASALRGTHF